MNLPLPVRLHHCRCFVAALALVFGFACHPARADVFLLENGGRVEGEWVNRQEQPLLAYRVRTTAGVQLRLEVAQVREAIQQSPASGEYERLAPTFADTVADQWRLAEWCREQRLTAERRRHLERILTLDPNHQQARGLLGFHFINGQWVTQQDFRHREGFEFYRGRWRTPQEIEILEVQSKRELAEKEWLVRLKRWRHDLDTDNARLAYDSLLAIKDPAAARPVGEYLSHERVRRVKMLYCDVLANIATGEATNYLVQAALGDPDDEIFHYAINRIVRQQLPHIADPFIAALKDTSNFRVNRAAMALARIEDKSAISPLIDALVTTHARVLPGSPGSGPDSTSTTFSSQGTSMKKNEGPHVVVARIQNQAVLDALTHLSGGSSFGFDPRAGRYWHAQENQSQPTTPTLGLR
jgi:hypothetical protein